MVLRFAGIALIALMLGGCTELRGPAPAPYMPLTEAEGIYGRLITAGNHPTPNQYGTGERLGFFQDASGTVWGLPVSIASDGAVLACGPRSIHDVQITDTFPKGWTIIGSANGPTGWRGGTGDLELLLRDGHGDVRWREVRGARIAGEPACWAPRTPGPVQELYYYRLAPVPQLKPVG